jgi:hypothetical protein
MDEITINIVELASELADRELRKTFKGKIDVDDEGEGTVYSNEAQDEFNDLYDEFYSMIEKCK